jgi:trigger factor
MPKIVREEIDQLNNVITITIEKSDYINEFNKELQKYRKEASMKGFRKGKTPISVLRKMFGQGVLGEVVNKALQDHLFKYLEDEGIDFLGQPIPSDDQELLDINVKDMGDYEFKFDIGLAPAFDVDGTTKLHTYTKYVVAVADETIDQELENIRKQAGDRIKPEEDIQSNDIVTFDAVELEGDTVKDGGHEAEFSLLVSNVKNEEVKAELLTKKLGDTLRVNIFELEGDKEEYARKYLLKLEGDDADKEINKDFELTIKDVGRIAPAELNQEFFDKVFGEGNVSSEEEAREQIKSNIQQSYSGQGEALLSRDLQDQLLELNQVEFPEAFLKRWLKTANEETPDDVIEKEFDSFKKNLHWTLIRNKLAKQYEPKVEMEDIQKKAMDQLYRMTGGQQLPEDLAQSFLQRMLSDQKQVEQLAEEALTDKVFAKIKEEVNVEEKEISKEEFDQIIQEAQQAMQPQVDVAEEEE